MMEIFRAVWVLVEPVKQAATPRYPSLLRLPVSKARPPRKLPFAASPPKASCRSRYLGSYPSRGNLNNARPDASFSASISIYPELMAKEQ